MESGVTEESKDEDRLDDFHEEQEPEIGWRSGSEETVDTVVVVGAGTSETDKRMKSRNSDYGSYCNSPTDLAGTVAGQDISNEGDTLQHSPLIPTSENEIPNDKASKSDHPLDTVKLDMPPVTSENDGRFQSNRIPGEPLKTFLSALFLGTGFLATTFSLAFTHERVPDIKPLPDVLLDNIKYQSWGLDVSEYLLMISTISAVVVVLLHSHRLVILRRIWLLLGILYYYRALTMFITVLPKADETYLCQPRASNLSAGLVVNRVLTLISGGGLSINGKQVYCGDYIFSGHTVTLTMGYLAIKQYSPSRFFLLHWASLIVSFSGIIFLLLARGHYSIDVVVAYWVSSRIWWTYHTMANIREVRENQEYNMFRGLWWWYAFRYFEVNIPGPLPNNYSLPCSEKMKKWVSRIKQRRLSD